jgi:glycosyltransferase involved in cell wall biosynthesis
MRLDRASVRQSDVLAGFMSKTLAVLESAQPRLRVTFLAIMPAPYMIDLFDALHRDDRFELTVYFLEKPAVAAPGVYWKEKPVPSYASVLKGGWCWIFGARVHLNFGLFEALEKSRPEIVVVLGYSSLTCQCAMYWLWMKRKRWIFWGESPGFEKRGAFGKLARWVALRPVASMSNGIAAIGTRAAAAYVAIARNSRPVANIPYHCRLDGFLELDRDRANAVAHFLYCGQLVARKGVDLLVRAFCRVAETHSEVRLTLVGDGPLRETLTLSVPERIRPRVIWAGFHETDQLPHWFGQANVFVLPSLYDGWGVVVNQAIAAGMAIIASDCVGAAADLVTENDNGRIFPTRDEAALETCLRFFADNPRSVVEYGRRSRLRADEMTPARGADRWIRLLEVVRQRGPLPATARTRQESRCESS